MCLSRGKSNLAVERICQGIFSAATDARLSSGLRIISRFDYQGMSLVDIARQEISTGSLVHARACICVRICTFFCPTGDICNVKFQPCGTRRVPDFCANDARRSRMSLISFPVSILFLISFDARYPRHCPGNRDSLITRYFYRCLHRCHVTVSPYHFRGFVGDSHRGRGDEVPR